jgi:hypothetical protein
MSTEILLKNPQERGHLGDSVVYALKLKWFFKEQVVGLSGLGHASAALVKTVMDLRVP